MWDGFVVPPGLRVHETPDSIAAPPCGPGGTTGWAGSGAEFSITGPRVYFYLMMKL
jgi:hypothetical protein